MEDTLHLPKEAVDLRFDSVQRVLTEVEHKSFKGRLSTILPQTYGAGDIFVFQLKNGNTNSWKNDIRRWHLKGHYKCKETGVLKQYFSIVVGINHKTSKDFQKHVYSLIDPIDKETPCFIVHFVGNDSIGLRNSKYKQHSGHSLYLTVKEVNDNCDDILKTGNVAILSVQQGHVEIMPCEEEPKHEDIHMIIDSHSHVGTTLSLHDQSNDNHNEVMDEKEIHAPIDSLKHTKTILVLDESIDSNDISHPEEIIKAFDPNSHVQRDPEIMTVLANISKDQEPPQIHQIPFAGNVQKTSVTYEEICNLKVLSKTELCQFIKYVRIFPSLVVICGDDQAINLGNRLLKHSHEDQSLELLISYDNTFELGNFYLTPLVMNNIELVNDPVFPVLFMLHFDKNPNQIHDIFWRQHISKCLKINERGTNAAITTNLDIDMLNAVVLNIKGATNLVLSPKHLFKNVESWFQLKGNTSDDLTECFSDLQKLLCCSTKNQLELLYSKLRKNWSLEFVEYADSTFYRDLLNYASHSIIAPTMSMDSQMSTNIENILEKMAGEKEVWYTLPVDAIIFSLFLMQLIQ